eukprot:GHRQ01021848.1.p1 GENE.GHRQ01021848.1~~GHRQ01021848.1.p1  ORF type:complete len:119 (+),score=23.11 GHRQ01021848.1:174-530(+)
MPLYAVRFASLLSLSSASGLKAASACSNTTQTASALPEHKPIAAIANYRTAMFCCVCVLTGGRRVTLTLRMLDFMSDGGSLEILMQVCRMDSGTIFACKHTFTAEGDEGLNNAVAVYS